MEHLIYTGHFAHTSPISNGFFFFAKRYPVIEGVLCKSPIYNGFFAKRDPQFVKELYE